jgi:phosphosulfolactate synthase (CoM biosynthesis protein A)
MDDRAFSFLPINRREAKPRQRGLTEIRGPYYSVMGARYLTDLAHGSPDDVSRYTGEARALGFDLIELSTGFISLPPHDLVALIKAIKSAGLKAKPELGIQFGAGGATETAELAAEGRATSAGSSPRRAVVWRPEPSAS